MSKSDAKVPTAWYVDLDWSLVRGIRPPEVREVKMHPSLVTPSGGIIMGSVEIVRGKHWFDTKKEAKQDAVQRLLDLSATFAMWASEISDGKRVRKCR